MRAVDEAVEDGVGDGRIVEPGMPVVDGQLAGDDRGLVGAAIVDDFEQVVARGLVERRHAPVVEDQHVHPCELAEQPPETAVRMCNSQRFGQSRYALIEDRESLAAGLLAERAGEPGLADAGRAGAITPGITAELSSCVISFTRCAACRFEWSACVDRSPERCSSLSGASSVVSACRSG